MRTKPGRTLVQFWMPDTLKAKLEAAAEKDGLTVALFLRRLLSRKLA